MAIETLYDTPVEKLASDMIGLVMDSENTQACALVECLNEHFNVQVKPAKSGKINATKTNKKSPKHIISFCIPLEGTDEEKQEAFKTTLGCLTKNVEKLGKSISFPMDTLVDGENSATEVSDFSDLVEEWAEEHPDIKVYLTYVNAESEYGEGDGEEGGDDGEELEISDVESDAEGGEDSDLAISDDEDVEEDDIPAPPPKKSVAPAKTSKTKEPVVTEPVKATKPSTDNKQKVVAATPVVVATEPPQECSRSRELLSSINQLMIQLLQLQNDVVQKGVSDEIVQTFEKLVKASSSVGTPASGSSVTSVTSGSSTKSASSSKAVSSTSSTSVKKTKK